jgi:hypothetical protein
VNGLTVVYDGWDLVYRPNSPAAIHLLALLDAPLTEWASILVVPGDPFHRTPDHVRIEIVSTPKTSTAHLRWEQRLLPKLAQRVNADLVHWLEGGPSLFSGVRNVVSPAGQPLQSKKLSLPHDKNKFAHRLRDAMAQGGLARASAVFWPVDLPEPELGITTILLPPVSPGWYADKFNTPGAALESQGSNLNLPETYILYHGLTDHHSLVGLLESWSWAAGAIGSYYPILIVGVDDYERSDLESWIAGQGFAETVHLLPPLSKSSLLYVYRNCSAVFHPAQSSPYPMHDLL